MRILFVCLGNICRSPAAENTMRAVAEKEGISDQLELDSAGTIGMHAGSKPDARMTAAAGKRGITMTGTARHVKPSDFSEFDLILAMDGENFRDLELINRPADAKAELAKFCDFCDHHPDTVDVPDPYYGGEEGFETVMDLLEDGCRGIAERIQNPGHDPRFF